MPIAAKLDEWGLPAWIALMVFAFIVFWPLGLAVLAFLIWSGRMGCGMHGGYGRFENKMSRLQEKMDRMRGRMEQRGGEWWRSTPSSGNRAFDEYKEQTMQRLEEEQREFREFLERLRFSKDRAEFDQFMADRRNRQGPAPQPQG
jgi:Protein of unknown function (DUF2852)